MDNVEINEIRDFYDGFLEQAGTENDRHRWIYKSMDAFIPGSKYVLDVGCGVGFTSRHLAESGHHVTAVDLSPVLISHAKRHNAHNRITYVADNFVSWECKKKFDHIVVVDVIEHIRKRDIYQFIGKLKSLSHEKTGIYLNIPNGDTIEYLKKCYPSTLQIVDIPYHPREILGMFRDIDFVPAYFRLYWSQYAEYVFVTEDVFEERHDEMFKLLKEN